MFQGNLVPLSLGLKSKPTETDGKLSSAASFFDPEDRSNMFL
jgi:hypothetical protein